MKTDLDLQTARSINTNLQTARSINTKPTESSEDMLSSLSFSLWKHSWQTNVTPPSLTASRYATSEIPV